MELLIVVRIGQSANWLANHLTVRDFVILLKSIAEDLPQEVTFEAEKMIDMNWLVDISGKSMADLNDEQNILMIGMKSVIGAAVYYHGSPHQVQFPTNAVALEATP